MSTMLRTAVTRLIVLAAAAVTAGALALIVVAPQLDWSAIAKPPAAEKLVANFVLRRWVERNASAKNNPLAATAQSIKTGQREFGEHCAVCHGADGSARNALGAAFYPPIVRLERGAPGWSDGELYFIISNGIRYTAMPGFGPLHEPDDIWRIILWIRHLPHLSAQERAELSKPSAGTMEHREGAEDRD